MFRVEGHRRGSEFPISRYLLDERQARRRVEELRAESAWIWLEIVERLDDDRERRVWRLQR